MRHYWCLIKFSDADDVGLNLKKSFYCREKDLESNVKRYVEELRESDFFNNLYFDGYEVLKYD